MKYMLFGLSILLIFLNTNNFKDHYAIIIPFLIVCGCLITYTDEKK